MTAEQKQATRVAAAANARDLREKAKKTRLKVEWLSGNIFVPHTMLWPHVMQAEQLKIKLLTEKQAIASDKD